jgi:thiol:disulfide interchange protein DsbD
MRPLLALLLLVLPAAVPAVAGDVELLPVEQAFHFTAAPRGKVVRIEARIAEGYYLYRDRVSVEPLDGVTLGALDKPPGKVKQDPFFGDVQVYRGRVRFEVPVRAPAPGSRRVRLSLTSQGCADVGVCYPPHTQILDVTLAAAALQTEAVPATGSASPGAGLSALTRIAAAFGDDATPAVAIGGSDGGFLPVDEAFPMSVSASGPAAVTVRFDVAPGYYLYRERMGFEVVAPADALTGAATLPPGKLKTDAYFGEQEVYLQPVAATVPVGRVAGGTALEVRVRYQGCAEAGLCYPPQERVVPVVLAAGVVAGDASGGPSALSETDALARSLRRDALGWVLASFFAAGLLLAFTPCVLPTIPILSAIIAGQQGEPSGRRGFALSLVYVLAMSVAYTAAGVMAGLFGQNLQALFQHPGVLIGFSLLFVALSLAMFGLYELQLPVALQSRLATLSNRQRGGSYAGVAAMGVLSALIVGPCVAAPLAAALIVIGSTGDPVRGGLALFALGLGMGVPLLAVGAFGPRLLPRAGPWMSLVKHVFGIMLLAVAVYLLGRLLPDAVTLALWAALAVGAGLLFVLFRRGQDPARHARLRRVCAGLAALSLSYGAMAGLGAGTGGADPLDPLAGLTRPEHRPLAFQRVKTVGDLEQVLERAGRDGRPVMLDFYADWCVSCKQMERDTFSDPAVQAALAGAVLVQADVTVYDDVDKALLERFGLFGPPAILFFDRDGRERRDLRVIGFMDARDFGRHVSRVEAS